MSESFGGYRVDLGRHVVHATVVVPTLTCDASRSAVLTGITSFDEDGDRLGAFGVRSRCAHEPLHEAVTLGVFGELEVLEDLPVAGGDVVRLTRRYNGFQVRIAERFTNRTQGWEVTAISVDRPAVARSTEIGDALADVRGTVLRLAAFEPHWVRAVSADGRALQLDRPTRVRLVDDAGTALLIPTELSDEPRFRLDRAAS